MPSPLLLEARMVLRVLLLLGLVSCAEHKPPASSSASPEVRMVVRGPSDPGLRQQVAAALEGSTTDLAKEGQPADLRLVVRGRHVLVLGPEGLIRNRVPRDAGLSGALRDALDGHHAQAALLKRRGPKGSHGRMIEVELRPVAEQPGELTGNWPHVCPNDFQPIQIETQWTAWARNVGDRDLQVEAFVLGSAGERVPLFTQGQRTGLEAGGDWVELQRNADDRRIFRAQEPIGVTEHVALLGYDAEMPTALRATSQVGFRVVRDVTGLAGGSECGATRELTLRGFDVEPYLQGAPAALRDVLGQADALTRYLENADESGESRRDGVPYTQHDWSQGSDGANLEVGIDCSRSIWFAFTRAGLPYAGDNGQDYLPTSQMFDRSQGSCIPEWTSESSPMKANFVDCIGDPMQTGDVLVWQGVRPTNQKCVGHTVMVVDPEDFIGWGSHGWDASPRKDVGVEYQQIGAKTWLKWDRWDYGLKACWRHNAFIEGEGFPELDTEADALVPDEAD